jgi:hypothetical protein
VSAISDTPQKWLVDRIIPYGGLTNLCGEQGATKSLLALFLAKFITAPIPREFLGRKIEGRAASGIEIGEDGAITPLQDAPVAPVPVLYIDRENPKATVGERRGKIGILGRDNFRYWGDWLAQENLEADPQQVYPPEPDDPRILKWAMSTRGFIIFDSLQQWYGNLNENNNTDMTKLMNKFKRLSRLCAGVLVLHHTPKPTEDGPVAKWRGATAIVAIPEMSIALAKRGEGDDALHELRPIRFRCCAPWEIDYKLVFNVDGQGNHAIGVTRDQLVSEVIRERVAGKEAKVAEKESTKQSRREILSRLIADDPNQGQAALAEKANLSAYEVGKLTKGHWTFKATRTPKWEPVHSPTPETEFEEASHSI